ncbi:MAG: thiol reductant ABC exporter subunit CydD [Actinomycetales bacterium]|nr:thiol reductant ABC exporter subunit CydD [Actinomycetales bacterium]
MRPFDRRLLTYARSVRPLLAAAVASGFLQASLVIAQALLLARVVADVLLRSCAWDAVAPRVGWLAAVFAARALAAAAADWFGRRASLQARGELQRAVVAKAARLGAVSSARFSPGETAMLATSGVDALDAYFAQFLPLLATAAAVPLATWAVIAHADTLSGVIIAATLPLVPFFMVLVGRHTQDATSTQWASLGRLSGHLLDALNGLTTLRLFGRARGHGAAVRRLGEQHRHATTRVLRVTFLSALVLELLATVSIALVAVAIGLRLVSGHMDFQAGFLVLLLAPEVYQPLRALGVQYHAAADGAAAAGRIISMLDEPEPESGSRRLWAAGMPPGEAAAIEVRDVCFRYLGTGTPVLDGLSFHIEPGTLTAIVGPSGCGKTTVLSLLLKFAEPDAGSITVAGVDLREIDTQWWRSQIAYLPQHPWLPAGSLREAVLMARPEASEAQVRDACRRAGLVAFADVPAAAADAMTALVDRPRRAQPMSDAGLSLETEVGDGGRGVSLGQRRRIALARVLLKAAPIVVLDEPTASLDEAAEDAVVREVLALRDSGVTVITVQHRRALVDAADAVVRMSAAEVTL